jgi:hypothetical protein
MYLNILKYMCLCLLIGEELARKALASVEVLFGKDSTKLGQYLSNLGMIVCTYRKMYMHIDILIGIYLSIYMYISIYMYTYTYIIKHTFIYTYIVKHNCKYICIYI